MRLLLLVLLLASLPAQVHISNHAGNSTFTGWVRRGIDWMPAEASGVVRGHRFAVGRDLGSGARVLDVHVTIEAGEQLVINFGAAATDEVAPQASKEFSVPQPTIAGVPFALRSARADGAGLDVHWRTRVGELWIDLWCVLYPGQTWCTGELQISAHGPSRAAVVPAGFVLRGGEFAAMVLGTHDGAAILPAGTTIAAGQGYSTLPVVFALPDADQQSALAAADLAIGAVGLQNVWPLGNPSWLASRGSPQQWATENYTRARSSLLGWNADRLGILANAQSTGGEGDQVFVGAECGRGAESAGAELVNLLVAYGYARRPGKWREATGDGLSIVGHPDLSMFEGFPGTRYGGKDVLGLAEIPNRLDTHGWAEWREHSFRNRLFVAYRLTGSLALQWQIDQFARQFLFECTIDKRFSTSTYTGALRGYGWEALTCWWLQHTLEDRKLAAAVRDRWLARWRLLGVPRYVGSDYWDVRRDDRLGPGQQWLAYQQAAAVMFLDMAGEVCGAADARDAALRGAKAVLEHAFMHDGARWVGYGYVPMDEGRPRTLPDGAHFGAGIESWMVGAAVVCLRHDNANEQALAIVRQHTIENNVNGQWIAPDVLPRVDR